MDIDSAFDARSDWKSCQGGIDGRVSDPMYKVEEYVNRDQPIPQVGSSMMEEMYVMEVTGALGGPCHHVGGGAPPYQINTRARGHISQPGQYGIMTAVHTPLLGTLYRKDILDRTENITESRAGISDNNGGCETIHTQGYDTDMEKMLQKHRSPKFVSSIKLDKTPSVVGGRIEMFGSITDMISQWEGMEVEEGKSKDDLSTVTGIVIASTDRPGWKSSQAGRPGSDPEAGENDGRRGRKRLSKVIRNLSGKFEKREEEPQSQPGGEFSSKGRGAEELLTVNDMNISKFKTGFGSNNKRGNNAYNALSIFSKSDKFSTNERSHSRNYTPNSRQNVTNQRTVNRKRKAGESGDNLDQRNPKQTRFNSESFD